MVLFDLEMFQKLTATQDMTTHTCACLIWNSLWFQDSLKQEGFLCEKEQEEEILLCLHELPQSYIANPYGSFQCHSTELVTQSYGLDCPLRFGTFLLLENSQLPSDANSLQQAELALCPCSYPSLV